MSVEEWAREQAEERIDSVYEVVRGTWVDAPDHELRRESFTDGIVHAFDALLSDEAVEAAALEMSGFDSWPSNGELGGGPTGTRDDEFRSANIEDARAALQAAVDAVTKGDKP